MEEDSELLLDRASANTDDNEYREPCMASFLKGLGCFFGITCIPFFGGCCGACYPYRTVNKGSRGIVQEFGRVKREVGDGMHYINPITEKLSILNMKVQVIDLKRQNVMTSDKLSIDIDGVLYYQITNASSALFRVENVEHAITDLAYTTLRSVIGDSDLETCLGQRDTIAERIKDSVDAYVQEWGVHINSIQIKDIVVPRDIITSLSSTVIAEREAKAKIITAQANVKTAELIKKSADVLSTPAAMQIRSLEVVDRLAHSHNTKIVLLPADLSLQSTLASNLVLEGTLQT